MHRVESRVVRNRKSAQFVTLECMPTLELMTSMPRNRYRQ